MSIHRRGIKETASRLPEQLQHFLQPGALCNSDIENSIRPETDGGDPFAGTGNHAK